MKNSLINVSFGDRILSVTFLENAKISLDDVKEIYVYGNEQAGGAPYGVIFESKGHYQVAEKALPYIASNPDAQDVIAKAYVVGDKEAEMKTKFHFIFDKPETRPGVFKTYDEALAWVQGIIKNGSQD